MSDTHQAGALRHDWTRDQVEALFALDFPTLIHRAQLAHRAHFDARDVQLSTLLSIKTGACPEDCAYCPQSIRFATGLEREELLPRQHVVDAAKRAKAAGATRFCMGAAWRSPKDKDLAEVIAMVEAVKAEGLETCVTLGMLKARQAEALAAAGLDYYNHNLDTSPEYYEEIISTRTYQDRLDTLDHVRDAGLKVCCGGIVGMGEQPTDRAEMLCQIANLPEHPQSVPINNLVQVEGTPLHGIDAIDELGFVRTIAVAKIMMPASYVRLAAGREEMSEAVQTLCFLAGANSIFYGDELLTTANPAHQADLALLDKLGMRAEASPKYTELEAGEAPDVGRAPQAARA
ncbi:biotin synthase BioB [Salinisphaera sp.]|uniref:biotin synthase BioB n=1 Tax=Salinisphaera sp. TaxID=1914330 RepID=UPI002D7A1069|nr:biotin synthase BioB [Salinisphaera sp.]HET7315215.1 biotin synthase BioB [Salinisphaera sp.]